MGYLERIRIKRYGIVGRDVLMGIDFESCKVTRSFCLACRQKQ